MAETHSTMLPLGGEAPDFTLIDPEGMTVSPDDVSESKGLLVIFMCNHCPYVRHVREELARIGSEYPRRGVAVIAINSNDEESHPDESAEKMAEEIETFRYEFPYLIDSTQDVAKAYRAACTPDFFLFDESRKLVYRGQLDDSRPGNEVRVTGKDLRAAMDALLADAPISEDQKPSAGCNVKWRAGNEPDYA